ncbi:MAG: LysM peptidoglycan-binding domain-containing protein, partial [Treponema sp.]|nr:LysM peptidoglycan-binding domain-containing protein [Treponema sp.]
WGISRKYGVTVKDLCDANSISENGILSIGKKLIVPIFK